MKTIVCSVAGVCGAVIASLFGGWTAAMKVLLICMVIDYATGIVLAAIFHKSTKTDTGALNSSVGWKGLAKKIATWAIILVAHYVDVLLGTGSIVRDSAIIAFCLNEIISILENCGGMGVPIPKKLKDAIDLLRQKSEAEEEIKVEQGEAYEEGAKDE